MQTAKRLARARWGLPCAALAVVTLGALAPAAQAAAPKIDALEPPDWTLPGGVIDLIGTNFTDLVPDVEVTVGGEPAQVLEASPTVIKVILSQALKEGVHDVKLKVAKEAANVVKVKVLADNQENREKARNRDLADAGEMIPEAGIVPEREKYLTLDLPYPESRRGELYVVVRGEAKYPDGCVIFLSLKLDNRFVASVEAYVTGARFQAELGPFKRRLFASNYAVEAEFIASRQPGNVRRKFNAAFQGKQRDAMAQTLDRQYVRIGTPADEIEHLRLTRTHYETTIRRALDKFGELESNFCAAGRSGFRERDGSVKETLWEEWLSKRSLAGLSGDAFKKRVQELKGNKTFLADRTSFDEAAWREWLDFKWRADAFDVARQHAEFRDSWEIARYPDAIRDMEEALSVLLRLSQRRSQELYDLNQMGLHKNDEDLSASEGAGLVQILSGTVSPARFQNLLGKVESEVGIQRR